VTQDVIRFGISCYYFGQTRIYETGELSCVYNLIYFIKNVTEYCNVWVYFMTHFVARRDPSPVWNSGLQVGSCGSIVG
jgi:hypothetical protein